MKQKFEEIDNPTSPENNEDLANINNSSPVKEDHTAKVPNETLLKSFSFLDVKTLSQIVSVSKRWYQLSSLARDEKFLEICQEYNLIFLNAVKEFLNTYEKEFKGIFFKETFEEMKTCHYGDKTYYKLISIATAINAKKKWPFNENFLHPKEIVFFSEKSKELYNKLFKSLSKAVTVFTNDQHVTKNKPSTRLKHFIREIAQLLIRWQCYLFKNTEGFKIEGEIHTVYNLIEQANDFIGENISINYLNEENRSKHLICLQLQLCDFRKNPQHWAYEEIGSWDGDFNYTNLSGSVGLHCFIANPMGENNAYFTDLSNCEFDEIAPDLMARVQNISYTKEQKLSQDLPSLNDLDNYFMAHNDYIYNLGMQCLQPLLREKQAEIDQLKERITSLENKLNQNKPKSEEDTNEAESLSHNLKNTL